MKRCKTIQRIDDLSIISMTVKPNLYLNPHKDRVEATISYKSKSDGIQYMKISSSTIEGILNKAETLVSALEDKE
jgi:hypothetical protein